MVREAVFNMIDPYDLEVLDLFAGSGSYGITAYSLGANHVTFIEKNRIAYKTLVQNINNLKIDEHVSVHLLDYQSYLSKNKELHDLIILDPPYDYTNYENLINLLTNKLNPDGLIVLELNKSTKLNLELIKLSVIKDKNYGIKRIIIFLNNLHL